MLFPFLNKPKEKIDQNWQLKQEEAVVDSIYRVGHSSACLFNLYSFADQDSLQQGEQRRMPRLLLKKVEVRNMLVGYNSLVHVQTDNYQLELNEGKAFLFGHRNAGGVVEITDSIIRDCLFPKGMIYHPPRVIINTKFTYEFQLNQPSTKQTLEPASILLLNSTFANLNYGRVLLGVSKLSQGP